MTKSEMTFGAKLW